MSVKSNAQILKEILKELHDVKTELIETKNFRKNREETRLFLIIFLQY